MWSNKEKIFENIEDFEGAEGFVYKITHIPTEYYYIGRKNLLSKQNKKLGKKEIAKLNGPGRRPSTKLIVKEADWKNYWGSSKEFLKFVKEHNEEEFKKEILYVCKTKKQITYFEVKAQFEYGVLEDPKSFNDNIQGRFFKGDI